MKHDDENDQAAKAQHDLAHELAEKLLACVDAFVQEKSGTGLAPSVLLLGTEMPASVARRLCQDAGMTMTGMDTLLDQAAACSFSYYKERTKKPKARAKTKAPKAVKAAPSASNFAVGFIINPGTKYVQ